MKKEYTFEELGYFAERDVRQSRTACRGTVT